MLFTSLVAALCIHEPVVAMRQAPSVEAVVVSTANYSEEVRIVEEQEQWIKIQTTVDSYEGWIPKKAIIQLFERPEQVVSVIRPSAHLYHVKDTEFGPRLTLPFESLLELVDASDDRWVTVRTIDGNLGYIQKGDVSLTPTKALTKDEMIALSEQFLGLPYTWGGRSSFGYDCSGFVQMLYRQMQIYLPRDSKDQATWQGFKSVSQEELRPGDLIYWGLAEDKIRHAGLYLGSGEFIHASPRENKPYLRKSKLTDAEWNGTGTGKFPYAFRTFRTHASRSP